MNPLGVPSRMNVGQLFETMLGMASHVLGEKFQVQLFDQDAGRMSSVEYVEGKAMTHKFDGHANCFIESGNKKGLLIDFNYTTEPLTGKFPIPVIGPMPLLKESYINHIGKLAFRWIYWNLLLKGRKIPVPTLMSMAGKKKVS